MIIVKNWTVDVPEEEILLGYVGENSVRTVAFQMDSADYSEWEFRLDMELGEQKNTILLDKDVKGDTLLLYFAVRGELLHTAGHMNAQLRALAQDGRIKLSSLFGFEVEKSISPAETISAALPDALQQMEQRLELAAVRTPYIGENGDWFVWDNTARKFVDSGKPANEVDPGKLYTKEQCDRRFASALLVSKKGEQLVLNGVQPDTDFYAFVLYGATMCTPANSKQEISPANRARLESVGEVGSVSIAMNGDMHTIPCTEPLRGLPDGTCDCLSWSGERTQKVAELLFDGTEEWSCEVPSCDGKQTTLYCCSVPDIDGAAAVCSAHCDRLTWRSDGCTADTPGFCVDQTRVYLRFPNEELGIVDADMPEHRTVKLREYLAEQMELGSPVTVYARRATTQRVLEPPFSFALQAPACTIGSEGTVRPMIEVRYALDGAYLMERLKGWIEL